MSNNNVYKEFDLGELNLLPSGWVEDVERVATAHSMHTVLDGTSVTSREPADAEAVEVFVVTGALVREHLPWLHNLYHHDLLDLAYELKGQKVVTAENLDAGVNINILRGQGSRYEWHVDSNPVTGLLFVTTHAVGSGGELVFRLPKREIQVAPKSGKFIVFDARDIPHTVMPLVNSEYRISIPMNYYFADTIQERPPDLEDYLYKEV